MSLGRLHMHARGQKSELRRGEKNLYNQDVRGVTFNKRQISDSEEEISQICAPQSQAASLDKVRSEICQSQSEIPAH